VVTSGTAAEKEANKALYPGVFGGAVPAWEALFPKNVANTGVCWHGGRLLALWEGSRPYQLDPISLATIGECDLDGIIGNGPMDSFSAHPCAIPGGGKANFAYFGNPLTGTTRLRFWEFEESSFTLTIPMQTYHLPGFGMYHDFIATDNWFVVIAAPSRWGKGGWETFKGALGWLSGKLPFLDMIEFGEAENTTAHFFPRRPGGAAAPVSVALDVFFAFHHANAYEDSDGNVVVDTVRSDVRCLLNDKGLGLQPDASDARFIFDDLDYELDVPQFSLVRYTVNLLTKKFSKRPLTSRHVDFPSVANSVRGRKSRYTYCSTGGAAHGVSPYMGVLKVDALDASKSQIWLPEPGKFCGESLFQPRKGSTEEDDGYVIALCFDGRTGNSDLVVLNAQHVDQGPIVRILIAGVSVPGTGGDGEVIHGPGHGLHGCWADGLVPSFEAVQKAEINRVQLKARFLSDPRPVSWTKALWACLT
jgi:all-trans-8'-apo-beta-carotenal 15,15'-oxygenase